MSEQLHELVHNHLEVISNTFKGSFIDDVLDQGNIISKKLTEGGKLLLMGNGGSAGDCQHIAAEFVSKLNLDRDPLPALALTVDSSALTAIGNDYGFSKVFSRQIQAICSEKDIVIGISTSGRSQNVIEGFRAAQKVGAYLIGFSGADGFASVTPNFEFKIQSNNTARIQEAHILLGHMLCGVAERHLV